ncbi:MAG: PsbP-related protein, partial [Desulfomonilaceae bacterium]
MSLLRAGTLIKLVVASVGIFMLLPTIGWTQDFLVFKSDEYGFTMKYPATWVKIDKPQGNYYVVFQAPELTDNFRSRIHVAAHAPVKDSLDVFKQELKQGIADMQKNTAGSKAQQTIKILDEGDFKCDVPGAYYFFIQAYEEKLSMWMDIVIVFYKHEDTLVRISCLAPSQSMEKFHRLFNDVLTSVKFV